MTGMMMLAFDHRASFRKILGGNAVERDVKNAKMLVYAACLEAVAKGKVGFDEAAVLCDEEFGSRVLEAAKMDGIKFALPVEKSGQDVFGFEYGAKFPQHVKKFSPTWAKVLVRYNPENTAENKLQLARLKKLHDWCAKNNTGLLFELLVGPTRQQLEECRGNKGKFDVLVRAELTTRAITEITHHGIRPAIWKLEGMDTAKDAKLVYGTCQTVTPGVPIIVLGRGESLERVEKWIAIGAKNGAAGFAVGRTIFAEPLAKLAAGRISEEKAVSLMAATYARLARKFRLAAKGK